ncbi:MAG: hypothetical protein ACOY4K_00450 [Pseudomonadota bacterium]
MTDADQLSLWLARGKTEVFSVVAPVSPDLARLLLGTNEDNRPILWNGSTRSVAAYAAAMSRGEWRLNGEAVIVSRTGELNDGQHRLHAVIQNGASVMMQIVFGVSRDTRHTVDQGIARTPGHILVMMGEANTNHLACALQFMWAIDEGLSLNCRPSTDQLLTTLDAHPDLRDALPAASKLTGHYRLSGGYIAAAHYVCRGHDAFYADQYLGALTTGLHLTSTGSPAARLRKAFEDHRAQLKGKKLDRITQAALYIKGFNNTLRGRTGPIAWRATGPTAESFPRPGA